MKWMYVLLLSCFHPLLPTGVSAENKEKSVFLLQDTLFDSNVFNLNQYAYCLVDSTEKLTIEQVQQQDHQFAQLETGITADQWRYPIWIRIHLQNMMSDDQPGFLNLGLHQYAEAYVFTDEQLHKTVTIGNQIPLYEREVSTLWQSTNNNTLKISLPPAKMVTIYAKVRNPYGPNLDGKNSQFDISLMPPDYLARASRFHLLSSIFCQGALWFILIFHLTHFFINRTSVYLWYCMFLFAVTLHLLDSDFFLLRLFSETYPSVADYMFLIVVGLVFVSYYQFSKVVITSTGKAQWAKKLLNILIFTQIAFFFLWLVLYSLNRFVLSSSLLLPLLVQWHTIYQFLIMVEIVAVIVMNILLIGQVASNVVRYYVAANTYLSLVLIMHFVLPFLLPSSSPVTSDLVFFLSNYSLEISILGQVLLFSIALAYVVKEKEQKMERAFASQLAEVEMQALRAQMNPHFIFNCLNSINRFVVKNKPAEASDYLSKFARLIRTTLQNSNHTTVPLADELEALRLYIEMELIRFDHQFTYELAISPNLETEYAAIPPMLLQPYVENAIWHGLLHKEDGPGHLSIALENNDGILHCIIEDNGIGREKAESIKSKTKSKRRSLGMKITEQRLKLLDRLRDFKAETQIVDLVAADGSALGTRVIIKMPLYFN